MNLGDLKEYEINDKRGNRVRVCYDKKEVLALIAKEITKTSKEIEKEVESPDPDRPKIQKLNSKRQRLKAVREGGI